MDEAEKIIKIIEQELTRWNNAQLHVALEFCEQMAEDTGNEWWKELCQMVELEIIDRGGRR